jgi:hypothetical protein
MCRHLGGSAFSLVDLLMSKRPFFSQVGLAKTQNIFAGLPFRLDSVLHANSFFVNELNPPPKIGFMDRIWDKLGKD